MERPRERTPDGVDRFLEDLRSGFDRRAWLERRRHRLIVDPDWRGGERRTPPRERRSGPHDRRRPPAGPFDARDTHRLDAILSNPALPAACPRCGGRLLRSETWRLGRGVTLIHCTSCRRRTEMAGTPANG